MIENTSQHNIGFGKHACILEQKSFRHTFKTDSKFFTFVPKLKFVQPFRETVGFDSYGHVRLILRDIYLKYNGHVFEKESLISSAMGSEHTFFAFFKEINQIIHLTRISKWI